MSSPQHWTPPRLSLRLIPILRRHVLVWRKLALPSLLANVADPLITLVAFGYGLGALLQAIDGVPYVTFLAGGAVCMSTMLAASFESLYSAYSRMNVQRTWESLLHAPLNLDDVLAAEWLWAALKGCISGTAIVLVAVLLDISRAPTLLALAPLILLTGLVFSAIGLCFNALAHGYDFFSYYFTLALTPMTFLSGVYFPIQQLPAWLQPVCEWLPLTAAVQLARPLVLGQWPSDVFGPVAVLVVYALAGFWLATFLTRRRFVH